MADYGIKVTRDGYDIDSTEPRDYLLNSSYSSVKIVATGSGTLTVNAWSTNSVSINHGLSFVPLVLFFCELSPGSGKWFSGAVRLDPGDADAGDIYVEVYMSGSDYGATYVDSTAFKLMLTNDGATNRSVDYFYIFFGDTGE